MHFQLSTFHIGVGLLLSAATSAYVVDTWSNDDCTGDVQSVNVRIPPSTAALLPPSLSYFNTQPEYHSRLLQFQVWDNTCATWMNGFQSFRITWPGADYQYLVAYSKNSCSMFSDIIYQGEFDPTKRAADTLECQEYLDINTGKLSYVAAPCVKVTNENGGSNALGSQLGPVWG